MTPFLDVIAKQDAFYRDRHIDMFKDGISVPGISLLCMCNDLSPDTNFTVFNKANSDLHHLVKDNIVGGPAIIFHRYHEKDVTKIRGGELCRTVVGYDAAIENIFGASSNNLRILKFVYIPGRHIV